MFATRYCISNKRNLKHPPGIYYIIKDENILNAWSIKSKPKKIEIESDEFKHNEINNYISNKRKSVADMFGGFYE